jgi:hypothetical protein
MAASESPLAQPLPLHAYYWRRRCVRDLQTHQRQIAKHRDDIQRLQRQLALRVSGIENVLSLLGQAVDLLNNATPDAVSPYGQVIARRRGRPRQQPTPAETAAVPPEAAA